MKKITLLLTVFLFCTITTRAQLYPGDLHVKDTWFYVPIPVKEYVWDWGSYIKFYREFVPVGCVIQNSILDSFDYKKYLQKDFDNMNLERFMAVGYKDNDLKPKWNFTDFNKFMDSKTDILIYSIDKVIDSTKLFTGIKKSKIKLNKFNVVRNLCTVYAKDSTFGVLSYELKGDEKSSYIKLCVTNYIKIKKKLIIFMVFAIYNNKDDIIWLKETSENWIKAFLEAKWNKK